jgi:hypothetical protein
MKIFAKRSKGEHAQNALPGVFVLFEESLRTVRAHRMIFAGYAAWAIIPALLTFGLSYISLPETWNFVVQNSVLVVDLVLSIWVQACIALFALSLLHKEELDEKEISARVRKAMPALIYLFGFSLFCIVVGAYLLLIPGVLAWVWLAFTSIIPLDQPRATFSQALRTSTNLSKGRFFSVLWRLLMGEVMFGLLYFFFSLVVLGVLFAFAGIDPKTLFESTVLANIDPPAWITLVVTTLSLPILPYATTYTVALYEALKKA